MKLSLLPYTLLFTVISLILMMTSCFSNDETANYSEWREKNQAYIDNAELEMIDGHLVYEKITPNWDNNIYVLMHWINDRSETEGELTPLSNSTVRVKYTLTNIEGDTIDSSASFNMQPNSMITGFWTAVTHMHVSDTVNVIIPYAAGYGTYGSGKVLPYSTLLFGIRLDSIVSYEKKW